MGLFCVGIDNSNARLAIGQSRHGDIEYIVFFHYCVNPENVDKLPAFDIICLLTVYHYFGLDYGWEAAECMLQKLGEKSDKIFFEPPGEWSGPHPIDGPNEDSFEDAYISYIESIFDGQAEVEFVGNTDFKRDTGNNPIFIIYTESDPE